MIGATVPGRVGPRSPQRRPGIAAIGVVRHGLHHAVGLACLDRDDRPASLGQPIRQPDRERAGLHAYPHERRIERLQGIVQRVRRALGPHLLDDRPRPHRPCRSRSLPTARSTRHRTSWLLLGDAHAGSPSPRSDSSNGAATLGPQRNPHRASCPSSFPGASSAGDRPPWLCRAPPDAGAAGKPCAEADAARQPTGGELGNGHGVVAGRPTPGGVVRTPLPERRTSIDGRSTPRLCSLPSP